MTLIITALRNDGACVCADRSNKKPNNVFEDNLYKIYLFKDIPLIIFNHGINKFNGKSWEKYCSDYESSSRWTKRNLHEISNDFQEFIKEDVEEELKKNFLNGLTDYTVSAFDFCGKTAYDTNFKIYERAWSYDANGVKLQIPSLGKFVLSGDGKDYLSDYLSKNENFNKDNYWANLSIDEIKDRLKNLFEIAIKEQKQKHLSKNIFSETYDIKCIS